MLSRVQSVTGGVQFGQSLGVPGQQGHGGRWDDVIFGVNINHDLAGADAFHQTGARSTSASAVGFTDRRTFANVPGGISQCPLIIRVVPAAFGAVVAVVNGRVVQTKQDALGVAQPLASQRGQAVAQATADLLDFGQGPTARRTVRLSSGTFPRSKSEIVP